MELTLECMVPVVSIHCSLMTLNIRSDRYLRLSGIIADCTSLCVVALSASAIFTTLIPHCLFKSSCVVFECRSADKKDRGCLMLVVLFGGSGMVSMWMSFTSFSVASLDTCHCCSPVALSIAITCLPDIWTLATILWLKRCVLNMMFSSFTIWLP